MLRYLTAGESHGKMLVSILEGLPQGLVLDVNFINRELKRRQSGYGRGARMKLESDRVEVVSGVRKRKKKLLTLGSPLCLLIRNKDVSIDRLPDILTPRPGHADLAGVLKYGFDDARSVLERASARETAARVAIGAACKILLKEFEMNISSKIISIGGFSDKKYILKAIDEAKRNGETLGGIFQVGAEGVIPGLGSYVHYDRRIDGQIAQNLMSIPAIKGVEIGLGFDSALHLGSNVHDAIYFSKSKGFYRRTNSAGGLEGGITNGENIVVRCAMKPIATLKEPLASVNLKTKRPQKASIQRSDVCAVHAASVIAEAGLAFILAQALLEKFGCDSLADIKRGYELYKQRLRK